MSHSFCLGEIHTIAAEDSSLSLMSAKPRRRPMESQSQKFTCKICERRFSTPEELDRHGLGMHRSDAGRKEPYDMELPYMG
jgi:hypothetical protein